MTLSSRLLRKTPAPRDSYPVAATAAFGSASAWAGEGQGEDSSESEIKQVYQAGYDAGYAACREAFETQTTAAVAGFRSMVDDLAAQRRRLLKEAETSVLKVACDIARRIVGKSAEIRQEVVLDVVKNALGHMQDSHDITIRVNPRDHEVVENCQAEWLESARAGGIRIDADARIKPGGCLIEGGAGSIEAQLDRQIDVIEKALLEVCK
jgi:flagellar assembly protein FliH